MSKLPRLLPLIAIAIGGIVTVRAAGLAPELFQGARAWAEEAAPAAQGTAMPVSATAPAVCALSEDQLAQQAGISPAELRIIQSLSARRGELDARDQDFATMLPLMAAAEQRLDERLAALEAVKTEVEQMLGQADEREQAEIDRLVQVYQAMRPREAAPVFTSLADEVRLPVAQAMRPRALAAIMAQMPAAAARELTEKLARRYEAQQLAARAEAAAQNTAAQNTTAQNTTGPAPAAPTQTAQADAAPRAAQPRPRPAARQAQPQARAEATPPAPEGPQPYQPAAAGSADAAPARQTVQ